MLLKIIFAHLLGMGIVTPMGETNDDREMYTLYIVNAKKNKVFHYDHAYEEEILEYIDTHTFEYNACIRLENDKLVDICNDTSKNK
tara:strand:- start:298 stop:555 length:258 start_codon:yes stop_codon:yes gene_type:complete